MAGKSLDVVGIGNAIVDIIARCDDAFISKHDLAKGAMRLGDAYDTLPAADGAPTARCLILVTPDGERTMNTFLGASVDFQPEDLDLDLIGRAKIVYLEGYLFDRDPAKAAFREAARAAKEAGAKVALSLSDAFCVDRHRDDFRALVREGADIVFANEKEITSLYQVNSFGEAAGAALNDCEMAVLTRSEAG